jgi:signal transduction histidine kinase
MSPLAEAHSVLLKTNVPPMPCRIQGDQDRLQQVLTNLIDNGIRHSPPEQMVTLEVSQTNRHARISVVDQGPGIAPEDLPYIFERFWRGDKSRSRRSGGSGLGLSIVNQLVQLHGGSVKVTTPENGGCRVDVLLPRVA